MFKPVKEAIQRRYLTLSKDQPLGFYKDVDRVAIWEAYLNAFPESERQEHNCNACRSFIRQYGGLVYIINNKAESIWNIDLSLIDDHYKPSIASIRDYVNALPVTNVFLTFEANAGLDKNRDREKNIVWDHFSLHLAHTNQINSALIAEKRGEYRTGKEVYKRAMEELTLEAAETVLELIAQNSLYRGKEFERAIRGFIELKKEYDTIPVDERENYCWVKSSVNPAYNFRGSVIGTLVTDLSDDEDLDTAVRKYEAKVAPANYKRPTALITPKMVESAKQTLTDLGLIDSLERRFANVDDVSVNDILFVDRSSEIKDVFDEMATGTLVNPRKLSKVEEVSMEDFIQNILPTVKKVEVLLETPHLSNLVSIVTSVYPQAKHLFKWNNPFSWSYTGGVADSIKERVKEAGGNVEGVLRFSIQWNDEDTKGTPDFDAHAQEPNGQHIYYASYKDKTGSRTTPYSGFLDVDMRGVSGEPTIRVENITWKDRSKMRDGIYQLSINNFNSVRNTGFKAQIAFDGESHEFYYPQHVTGTMQIATVTLAKGSFSIQPKLDAKSNVSSREKWGVKTNTYTTVKNIMLSPNYWDGEVGNKHYFFMLDGCINDEDARPFYNEHLKQELNEHRKVFEVMAGKLIIPHTTNQLSGVGFSETIDNSLIVRVTGAFKRNLKIKIKNG